MHATATHHPAPIAPTAERSGPASKPVPRPATLAVWEAEDGRCEACGRPMDKTCARTGRDKRGERRLVCPDCKTQQPDPLATAIVSPKTAAQLAPALGTIRPRPEIRIQPQARTRGLPRLRAPGTAPDQQTKDLP